MTVTKDWIVPPTANHAIKKGNAFVFQFYLLMTLHKAKQQTPIPINLPFLAFPYLSYFSPCLTWCVLPLVSHSFYKSAITSESIYLPWAVLRAPLRIRHAFRHLQLQSASQNWIWAGASHLIQHKPDEVQTACLLFFFKQEAIFGPQKFPQPAPA